MKIVLDTNVLLVSYSPKSEFRRIFDAFLNEEIILCVTTDILYEYEEILNKRANTTISSVILSIIENASNVEFITKYYQWQLISEDPDDDKFVDCAIASNATFLVSDDKHFNGLKLIDFPKVNVITAEEFLIKLNGL